MDKRRKEVFAALKIAFMKYDLVAVGSGGREKSVRKETLKTAEESNAVKKGLLVHWC